MQRLTERRKQAIVRQAYQDGRATYLDGKRQAVTPDWTVEMVRLLAAYESKIQPLADFDLVSPAPRLAERYYALAYEHGFWSALSWVVGIDQPMIPGASPVIYATI